MTTAGRPPTEIAATAVAFDLDGVLVDSAASIARAWRRWADDTGVDWGRLAAAIPGRTARDTIRLVVGPERDDGWVDEAADRVNAAQIADPADTAVFPDIAAFYREVPADRVAIVTSAPRALAVARLRRRSLPVPAVLVAGEDVARGKPDPEGWLRAADRLATPPDTCLAVEDAPVGVASALAAGLPVVAVATTHPPHELAAAHAVVAAGAPLHCRTTGTGLAVAVPAAP